MAGAGGKRSEWRRRAFEPLPLLPDGTKGRFSVKVRRGPLSPTHRNISPEQEDLFRSVGYYGRRVSFPHPYNILTERQPDGTDQVWMSSTPWDVRPLLPLVDWLPPDASVLMVGLGLGVFPRLLERERKSLGRLVVVERSQHVIDLVWPHVGTRWPRAIYAEDADGALDTHDEWRGAFDLVFIDTWPEADYLYLPVATRLLQKAKPHRKRGGKAAVWLQRAMTICLRRELIEIYQLVVPELRAQPEKHEAFRGQWPHFWPFVEWGMGGARSEEDLSERIHAEIQAFKAGQRKGLYTST